MTKLLFLLMMLTVSNAHSQSLPPWFLTSFKSLSLNKSYNIKPYLNPASLQADFNGDGIKDLVTTIVEKKSGKKGLLIMLGSTNKYIIVGAGKVMGISGTNYGDDLKWADSWAIYKNKFAYETKFDKDYSIVGTLKRKITNTGITVWQSQEGAPLAGFILFWNGKKWQWVHQGE